MSQGDLANKIEYSQSYISRVEQGKELVSDKLLEKLEEVFHVDLSNHKSWADRISWIDRMSSDRTQDPDNSAFARLAKNIEDLTARLEQCRNDKEDLMRKVFDLEKQLLTNKKIK